MKNNILNFISIILFIPSIFLFYLGFKGENIYYELYAVLLIFSSSVIFHVKNSVKNIVTIFFYLTIFLFVIGRPTISFLKNQNFWYVDFKSSLMALHITYISLISIFIISIVLSFINLQPKNSVVKSRISIYIKYLVYGAIIFKIIVRLVNFILLRGSSYTSLYLGNSGLPSSILTLADVSVYLYFIYLALLPTKKEYYNITIIYFISLLPNLLLGLRGDFSSFILVSIVYIFYRHYVQKDTQEVWLNKKILSTFFVFLLGIMLLLSFVGNIRENKKSSSSIIDFVYLQGTTFDTMSQGVYYNNYLPKRENVNYTFSSFSEGVKQNPLIKILVKSESYPSGNSAAKATKGENLAHNLSYVVLGDSYLTGHGRGTSYILENYLDFGRKGVVAFSVLLGMILFYLPYLFKNSIAGRFIALNISIGLFSLPRGEATSFLIFFFDIKLWLALLLVYIFKKLYDKTNVFDVLERYRNERMSKILKTNFVSKLRLINVKDIFSLIFIYPLAYIVSRFYRSKNKNLILVCESEQEARDNGYWLYKYIREKYSDENIVYVIDFNSPDYNKVKSLGKCINYGSFKHWIYYLSANVVVST